MFNYWIWKQIQDVGSTYMTYASLNKVNNTVSRARMVYMWYRVSKFFDILYF